MSSGRFDCTEPSLTTALQGKQGVQGASRVRSGWFVYTKLCLYDSITMETALLWGGSRSRFVRYLDTCSGRFNSGEAPRTC